jgi:hypothetical protein
MGDIISLFPELVASTIDENPTRITFAQFVEENGVLDLHIELDGEMLSIFVRACEAEKLSPEHLLSEIVCEWCGRRQKMGGAA